MKVLFWAETFLPVIGGVEVFSQHLLRALVDRGHEFLLIAAAREASDEWFAPKIRVIRFPFRAAVFARDLRQIGQLRAEVIRLKQAYQPDLIHLNSTLPSAFFHERTANVVPIPTLLTLHVPIFAADGSTSLVAKLLRSADYSVAVSQAILDQALQLTPEIASRASVIHNSLSMPTLPPSPLPIDPPVILGFGRLAKQKGFDVGLEAMAKVLERFPAARLVLAGDDEQRTELEQRAAQLGITHATEFTGWVQPDRIPELINRASLVIVPSRFEPFGLVALQSMHMARPVIASSTGGLPEIIVPNETGLLVEKENSDALAQAIIFLIEHPHLAAQYGQAGQARARQAFGFQRFVEAYEHLYQQLGSQAKHDRSL